MRLEEVCCAEGMGLDRGLVAMRSVLIQSQMTLSRMWMTTGFSTWQDGVFQDRSSRGPARRVE